MSALADKLREARALIQRGWAQGWFERGDRVCSYGAINKAFTGSATDHSQTLEQCDAEDCLRKAVGGQQMVAHWNDNPKRTQAEVLAMFDKAIALAEQVQA